MQRFEQMLLSYPADCQPSLIEPLRDAGGFSGALLWRLTASRGKLCLRRWPIEQSGSRLEWIQRVVRFAADKGFTLLPAPLARSDGSGFGRLDGHLWELTTWLPGRADYWNDPRPERLDAALSALAEFHRTTASFPHGRTGCAALSPVRSRGNGLSVGISDRTTLTTRLSTGYLDELRGAVAKNPLALPALVEPAGELLWQIEPHLAALERQLNEVRPLEVPLQPCLRDIWHDHVLFVGDRVSGFVDLGSTSIESVAADVARLLGSLCGNDKRSWSVGMAAYEALRPLSEDERKLVAAFDRSNMLLAGVKWVEWVFAERRRFADPTAVLRRMEHILDRLAGIYQDE